MRDVRSFVDTYHGFPKCLICLAFRHSRFILFTIPIKRQSFWRTDSALLGQLAGLKVGPDGSSSTETTSPWSENECTCLYEKGNLPDTRRRTMSFRVLVQHHRTMEALSHLVSITNRRDVVNRVSDEQDGVVSRSIEIACVWPFRPSMPLCNCSEYI